uniref:Uncharacterized protein n=1 Tax=Arundo donax TaxID=35708 RepID=A0A0A9ADM0_ARUDO
MVSIREMWMSLVYSMGAVRPPYLVELVILFQLFANLHHRILAIGNLRKVMNTVTVFQVFLYPNSTVLALNNHLGTNFKVLTVQELLHGLRLVMQWVIFI